jgi:hypothetical protein
MDFSTDDVTLLGVQQVVRGASFSVMEQICRQVRHTDLVFTLFQRVVCLVCIQLVRHDTKLKVRKHPTTSRSQAIPPHAVFVAAFLFVVFILKRMKFFIDQLSIFFYSWLGFGFFQTIQISCSNCNS